MWKRVSRLGANGQSSDSHRRDHFIPLCCCVVACFHRSSPLCWVFCCDPLIPFCLCVVVFFHRASPLLATYPGVRVLVQPLIKGAVVRKALKEVVHCLAAWERDPP